LFSHRKEIPNQKHRKAKKSNRDTLPTRTLYTLWILISVRVSNFNAKFSLRILTRVRVSSFKFQFQFQSQICTNATQLLPHFLRFRAQIPQLSSSFHWGFDHSLLLMDAQPVEPPRSHISTNTTFSSIPSFFSVPFLEF
jgi:hypothetical protein